MNTQARFLLVLGGIGAFVVACFVTALLLAPTEPDHQLVSTQGMVRLIVTSETSAADDDRLLAIAEQYLRRTGQPVGERAVALYVWTDRSQVPTRLEDITDLQAAARRATVWINERTSLRKVER